MIIELTDTDTTAISKQLVRAREQTGLGTLGRVLTLVVFTDAAHEAAAIATADDTAREHSMRVIVVVAAPDDTVDRVDAQLRLGTDTGASEVIVIRARGSVASALDTLVIGLLLPDTPVVLWFTGGQPISQAGALDTLAVRRITDVSQTEDPVRGLRELAREYRPGATDLAWAQLSLLRGQLAATLDQPPFLTVTQVAVSGDPCKPELRLLAAWLAQRLGVPVQITRAESVLSVLEVRLTRPDGDIVLTGDPQAGLSRLQVPDLPEQTLPLTQRTAAECLSEDLRSLDEDTVYAQVLRHGLPLVADAADAAVRSS